MIQFAIGGSSPYTEEGRSWYDTKKGVAESIKTLSGLLHLLHERWRAGYVREESLNEFHILGLYYLDSCGNCGVSIPLKKKYKEMPDVLTQVEFDEFLTKHSIKPVSFLYEQTIPSEHVRCPVCNECWTLATIDDVVQYHKYDDFSITEFAGQTLREVCDFYGMKEDKMYSIGTEPFLQNEMGWVGKKEGITDEYVVGKGDILTLSVKTFFHFECNRKNLETQYSSAFEELFKNAGFSTIGLQSIANQYSNHYMYGPWFKVTTEIGIFTIGWRKRVININWSELNEKVDSIKALFVNEDVTKDDFYIHAWDYEKAAEYLSAIRTHLS